MPETSHWQHTNWQSKSATDTFRGNWIWKPLAVKTSNNMKSKLAKFLEVPNSAQNLAVSAISRHCAAVMLSKFSTRLKLILPVLHTAEGNILSYGRGAQNTDNLSLLYWHQSEGVNRSGTLVQFSPSAECTLFEICQFSHIFLIYQSNSKNYCLFRIKI
jgi:hypothetical protein